MSLICETGSPGESSSLCSCGRCEGSRGVSEGKPKKMLIISLARVAKNKHHTTTETKTTSVAPCLVRPVSLAPSSAEGTLRQLQEHIKKTSKDGAAEGSPTAAALTGKKTVKGCALGWFLGKTCSHQVWEDSKGQQYHQSVTMVHQHQKQ